MRRTGLAPTRGLGKRRATYAAAPPTVQRRVPREQDTPSSAVRHPTDPRLPPHGYWCPTGGPSGIVTAWLTAGARAGPRRPLGSPRPAGQLGEAAISVRGLGDVAGRARSCGSSVACPHQFTVRQARELTRPSAPERALRYLGVSEDSWRLGTKPPACAQRRVRKARQPPALVAGGHAHHPWGTGQDRKVGSQANREPPQRVCVRESAEQLSNLLLARIRIAETAVPPCGACGRRARWRERSFETRAQCLIDQPAV